MGFLLLEIASVAPGHDPLCPLVPVAFAFAFPRWCPGAGLLRLAAVAPVLVWCSSGVRPSPLPLPVPGALVFGVYAGIIQRKC